MFGLRAASTNLAPSFVPEAEDQIWLMQTMKEVADLIGPQLSERSWFHPPSHRIDGLDGLFELVCAVQERLGQHEVELTVVAAGPHQSQVPPGFVQLADASGLLMTTWRRDGEYALMFDPAAFRKQELLLSHAARELGRITLDVRARARADGDAASVQLVRQAGVHAQDPNVRAELAAILSGLGVWVANGSYIFENACCGGGCGINLSRLRAGLSLPEAGFALAIDGLRRNSNRRAIAKHLAPTQAEAFNASWKLLSRMHDLAIAKASQKQAAIGA
jgi:hypothetical protein